MGEEGKGEVLEAGEGRGGPWVAAVQICQRVGRVPEAVRLNSQGVGGSWEMERAQVHWVELLWGWEVRDKLVEGWAAVEEG